MYDDGEFLSVGEVVFRSQRRREWSAGCISEFLDMAAAADDDGSGCYYDNRFFLVTALGIFLLRVTFIGIFLVNM